MLFTVGTEIQLIHTDDLGVVTGLLDNGMIQVRLYDGDLEIPIFPDDIRRVGALTGSVKARIVPGRQKKEPVPPPRPAPARQYSILKPQGIQVGFDPQLRADSTPEGYRVFLINDLAQDIIFTLQLFVKKQSYWTANGRLAHTSVTEVNGLTFDQLNDAPELDIQVWPVLTGGTGSRLQKRLRIKPKLFFKSVRTAPLLDRPVHLFKIFPTLAAPTATVGKAEDLRTYTDRRAIPTYYNNLQESAHEVAELAHFVNVIDLHINRLVADPAKVDKRNILSLQLDHFNDFMRQAIRLGVERVFVIHGLGEGKLREAIHEQLRDMPEIVSFKNEHHPLYGWGATEVIL